MTVNTVNNALYSYSIMKTS